MTRPDLVLDTNAFSARGFSFWLERYRGRKILPALAFVELGVLYERRSDLARLRGLLARLGVQIEWFRVREAERAIATGAGVADFSEHAADHVIASHAAVPGRVLVTENAKDFNFLANVVTPERAMRDLS